MQKASSKQTVLWVVAMMLYVFGSTWDDKKGFKNIAHVFQLEYVGEEAIFVTVQSGTELEHHKRR